MTGCRPLWSRCVRPSVGLSQGYQLLALGCVASRTQRRDWALGRLSSRERTAHTSFGMINSDAIYGRGPRLPQDTRRRLCCLQTKGTGALLSKPKEECAT